MQFVKKLGQNFLMNPEAISEIVAALEIKKGETIIEIGAGSGNLTLEILKVADQVIAIEKDKKWIEELNSKFKAQSEKLKIIEADVRDVLPQITENLENYKIVGNIPYYLTGQLLRLIQELINPPQLIILTIQKEVAERIMEQAPKSNQLALIISLWAKPKVLFNLKPQDFMPAPKVSSSVIKLEVLPKSQRPKKEGQLIDLIKAGFEQPRKTLVNNLSRKFSKENVLEALGALNFNEKTRPQELDKEVWIKLSQTILNC
jgi:16S rRNA (adenine1518-N6/adenine1519-N6)-dimethyltransferase